MSKLTEGKYGTYLEVAVEEENVEVAVEAINTIDAEEGFKKNIWSYSIHLRKKSF